MYHDADGRTGNIGRPGTKAPVEKRSRTLPCLVVPSGAIISSGYLRHRTRWLMCQEFELGVAGGRLIT